MSTSKEHISTLLRQSHNTFAAFLLQLSPTEFTFQVGTKWSAGEQLQHINLTLQPVVFAFSLPKWLLKWKFGTANRPSKTYEAIVKKYQEKLVNAAPISKQFTPKPVKFEQRAQLLKNMEKWVAKLENKILACSEQELDANILPHPLLGKITLREMIYFSTYHVQHHQTLIQKALNR